MNDSIFADRLHDAIADKGSPICAGIDPMFDLLPDAVAGPRDKRNANDTGAVISAFYQFVSGVLEVLAPIVPIVKFQSAYFEQYQQEGVEAYYSLIHEARERGLLVIGDIKRGDIGSTSTAYAAGHLVDPPNADENEQASPDAITINPMLGMDAIEPFVQQAERENKGLFVLVRTSNPGSADFQDVLLQSGRTWSEHVADVLHRRIVAGPIGQSGYSSIGAVVGATQTHTMTSLRQRLPNSIFLLPGYGTQGATAEMTRAAFDAAGRGAIVSASRSILYPKTASTDWKSAVRTAAEQMHADLSAMRKA